MRTIPTQKPLELYERIIKASSNKGDVVFDPFLWEWNYPTCRREVMEENG